MSVTSSSTVSPLGLSESRARRGFDRGLRSDQLQKKGHRHSNRSNLVIFLELRLHTHLIWPHLPSSD
jgi:hypothetical protein